MGPGEGRFHGHHPVEQVLLVVLEADVEHVRLAALGDVARHLQGHRRLAGALRAADQQQLAGADAAARVRSSGEKPERDRLVLGDRALADLVGQAGEHLDRAARAERRRLLGRLSQSTEGP